MPIEHISDTARWVAVYRAWETDRPDAHFRDPYARRLAGERGEEIVRSLRPARSMAWAMIVRTAVLDEMILRAVARDGVDLVVNLAAGLDARPYRLPLPETLRWVDVDLPEILEYKRQQLAGERPKCRLDTVALDLRRGSARRAFFERVGGEARRALIISEGLLVYLTAEEVAALAVDLHAPPSFTTWLIDIASPALLKMMHRRLGKELKAGNSPMLFAPAEGAEFFRPYGWRAVEYRSTLEEARRLRREMPFAWLWRLVGRLMPARKREEWRRMSGIVALGRA